MENTIPKWVIGLFLLALFAGTYFRVAQPFDRIPTDDEIIVMVAAAKLNTTHPSYDARYYNFEHPFLGKKILGLWINTQSKPLTETAAIPVNLFTYNYLAAEELREWEGSMRIINALFGIMALIPIFLIGRKWFGMRTGIMSVILFSIAIGQINLSRYLIQDGLLSFFYLSTVYFFLKYTDNLPGKWKMIEMKNIYLAATLGMWVLSLLIRIQQPILLGMGMLIALIWLKQPIRAFVLGSILGIGIAIIAYTPTALMEMIEIKITNAVSENSGVYIWNVLAGMISQNSYTALVLLGIGIMTAYSHKEKVAAAIESITRQPNNNPLTITVICLTSTPLLFSSVTSLGAIPRYFLIIFALPMIYLGNIAAHATTNSHKYLVSGVVLLDIALLFLVAPPFVEYSVLGLQPIFLTDNTPNQSRVIPLLDSINVDRFFTNDPGLLLRNPRAAPLPPNMKAFGYYDLCDENFSRTFHKSIIVYRSPEPFEESPFICPFAQKSAKLIPSDAITPLPPYEFYMVIDENQLSFTGA